MRIAELQPREKCRTVSGLYFKAIPGGYHNELGSYVYPKDYDEQAEILDDWPHLMEQESFRLISNEPKLPGERMIFKTEQNFRFFVIADNYRITIPFQFVSTDVRVGKGNAEWSARSGKIYRELVDRNLRIYFDSNNKPVLQCGSVLRIPKQ